MINGETILARKSKEDTEITKNNIIEAALKVFGREGFSGARLEDIAKEAGVTRGAVYHHFENKLGMFSALLNEVANPLTSFLENRISGEPILSIYQFYKRWFVNLEDDQRFRAVFEIIFQKAEHTEKNPSITEQSRNTHLKFRIELKKLIDEAINMNYFDKINDSETATIMMDAYSVGLTEMWLFTPDSFSIKEKSDELILNFLGALGDIDKIKAYLRGKGILI